MKLSSSLQMQVYVFINYLENFRELRKLHTQLLDEHFKNPGNTNYWQESGAKDTLGGCCSSRSWCNHFGKHFGCI